MENKKCTKCKETKPIEEFYLNANLRSGYTSWCKQCIRELQRNNKRDERKKKGIPPRRFSLEYHCPNIDKNSEEWALAAHLHSMAVVVEESVLIELTKRLKNAENILKELDKIENELNASKKNITTDFLDIWAQERQDFFYNRKWDNNARLAVYAYDLSQTYIGEFKSCKFAADVLDLVHSSVYRVAKGDAREIKGYVFCYEKI